MEITWTDQVPVGISFVPEEKVLTNIERLATTAGYEVADSRSLDSDMRSLADMVVRTEKGLLLFGVRQKSRNNYGKIDIETRPMATYRTRHLLLRQKGEEEWELRNDSDLGEGGIPNDSLSFRAFVERLFSD